MNKYDFIREMVPKCGVQWVAEALGATETDVRDACGYLGVRPSDGRSGAQGATADATWTEAEAAAVYALYTTRGTNIPSVRERHSAAAVKRWASRHGVRAQRGKAAQPWTEEEVETLRREYPERGGAIPELLDGGRRSVSAVRQKARALGVQCHAR